ncbi:DUF2254 family protein (plasmid) [Haloferax sp. S1W]|uniref:DUF2254 family protein n=1 Tax=Haloferax sp. S1W TaxID=3377110 RepID=UPI0037C9C490
MNFPTNTYKRFLERIPTTVLVSTLLFPMVGIAVSLSTNWAAGPNNTSSLLSALAGAQAGVLAIVFSVTLIGIQLIGTRYSPRMVSTFIQQPIFVYTFGLFVFSIALDLWLLYNVPGSSVEWHTAGVFGSSGMAAATAYCLFVFVQEATEQSTPEGAIGAFVSGMTAERYLMKVQQSAQNGSDEPHPMRPLYSLTMNALSQGERVTVEKAIREYGELVQRILRELDSNGVFADYDPNVTDELSEPVLTEHLVEIALHAEETDESQIVDQATEWQYKLGKDGLDRSIGRIGRHAERGLSNILLHAPVESSLIAANNAWRRLGKLLVDASEHPDPDLVWLTCSSMEHNVNRHLWKVDDIRWYQNSMMRLYLNLEKSHEALLEQYGDYLKEVGMDWQHEHVPDDYPHREEVRAIYQLKSTLFKTTESFLRFLIQNDVYPITEGNFKDNWQNICTQATKSGADDYATVLCQALIEIAFIHEAEPIDHGISWSSTIGRVMHNGNAQIVEAAFDRILEYDYKEKEPGPVFAGEIEEHPRKYYQNQIRLEDSLPLNNQEKFKQIIWDIRKEAIELRQKLAE